MKYLSKLILILFVLFFSSSYANALSKDDFLREISNYRPNYFFGFNFPLGNTSGNFQTGFTLGMNAFHKNQFFGSLHPGLNFSVNFLPPESTNDDSYIDISIIPSVRYFQPSRMNFRNPLNINDPFTMFMQAGFGICQWNTKGSSKLKVLDPSASDTDPVVNFGTGLTSERMEVMLLYSNIFAHGGNAKYFTVTVGVFF